MATNRRKKRKVKFTEKKRSVKGMFSIALDVVAAALTIASFAEAVMLGGNGTIYVGSVGVLAFLFAVAGLVFGVYGYRDKDVFLLLPKTGVAIGTVLTVALAAIYVAGIWI